MSGHVLAIVMTRPNMSCELLFLTSDHFFCFFFDEKENRSRRLVKSFFMMKPMPCVFRELRVK